MSSPAVRDTMRMHHRCPEGTVAAASRLESHNRQAEAPRRVSQSTGSKNVRGKAPAAKLGG
eukprot:12926662-Prorocentrum_lima.AAC.1